MWYLICQLCQSSYISFKFHFQEWENEMTLISSQQGSGFHATVMVYCGVFPLCVFTCLLIPRLQSQQKQQYLQPRTSHTEHIFQLPNLYQNTRSLRTSSGRLVEGLLLNLHCRKSLPRLYPTNLSIVSPQSLILQKIFLLCRSVKKSQQRTLLTVSTNMNQYF